MKINGPGQPPNPAISGSSAAEKPSKAEESGRPGASSETGKTFGEKLKAGATGEVRHATGATGPAGTTAVARSSAVTHPGQIAVHDLAAELRTGKLTPAAAIEKVLDRVVGKQLGPDAPAPIRDQVRAALQEALDGDPLLAAKLSRLQ